MSSSSAHHQPPPASPRATGGPFPVSPKFSPPPASSSSYLRPPVSPGGSRSGTSNANAQAGLHVPPLSPGGRKSNAAVSAAGIGSSLRSEALNRAHRRVRSGGNLSIPSSPAGRGLSVPRHDSGGGAGGGSYRRQHLQMRLSTSFDGGAAPSTGIGAFPSSPSHRGLPPSSPRRLRSVSYDESDAAADMPQDELDAIRAELEKRKEKQALHDQRRRELEEMMSSAAATTPKRAAPPTRKIAVTKTASGDDGISPLKMGDSARKDRRPRDEKHADNNNYDDGSNGNKEEGGDGNDRPTVVSPTSTDEDQEGETKTHGRAGRSDRATGGSGGSSGRSRGRSLTPRDRSVNGVSAMRGGGDEGGPPPRRLLSHSPAPQNMGVRRLGRAVDAVLARRKRRGSISAHNADPSTGDAAEPPEQYQHSLTDEEKHVLAKIIVAIDTKLERELDLVKADLQNKKKAEASAKEALKAEQKKNASLERELEQAKSGAAVAKALQVTEVTDDRINVLEKEHETSLRAIQRVLADVTTEKDTKLEHMEKRMKDLAAENDALKQKLASLSSQASGEPDDLHSTGEKSESDGASASKESANMKKRDDKIQILELRVTSLVEEKKAMEAELATAQTIASASVASKETELSKRDETIKSLEEQLASKRGVKSKETPDATNTEDIEKLRLENQNLRKDLQNKISSLETAKMMITSLESASGSQANDLRAKLKERNEELATLKVRADSSNSELATLKSELIHMQTKFVEADNAAREARIVIKKQRAVHRQLKAEISKIGGQSNNTIRYNEHGEVEVEVSLGGSVSSVVQKSLTILEEGDSSAAADNSENDELNTSGEMDTLKKKVEGLSEEKDAAIVRLNKDLVEKNVAIHNLDDQLNMQKEESNRLRQELEKARDEFRQVLSESQFEIQRLTDDFTIANEQLAKKEKELGVLKESLNEPSTGYISDDDDFDDDDDDGVTGIVPTDAAALQATISAEAENLQLLLKQAQQEGSSSTSTTNERLKALEDEVRLQQELAAKQVKEKDDALANAKMIISSLEQSNKSMLEDLRNRLHDSNTAIVSLLTKNQNLEGEVKDLKTKNEEEVRRFRNESTDELAELRQRVMDYERIAIRMGVDDGGSSLSSLGETKSSYFDSDENDITSDDVGITTDEGEGPSPLKLYPASTTDRTPEEGEEEV